MPDLAPFSSTYAQARARFLTAAAAAGLPVDSHVHALRGCDGEALAVDVVRDGAPEAARLLLVSSGCHGVEGYCGSGVQLALLTDAGLRKAARAAGVAMVYVHALNPHGFSFDRRVTPEGVDLNRNFCDFSQPLPHNQAYDDIAGWLLPEHWPPRPENEAALLGHAQRHGERAVQQAISGGQFHHPHGLFYGGRVPTWSHAVVRDILRRHARSCRHLGWIDLHTGLGPSGHGEKILACRAEAADLARVRAWWGPQVTAIHDGSSTSAALTGVMWVAAYEECPQAQYTGLTLEFGTQPPRVVLDALRGDHWLQLHPRADPALRAAIRRRTREAFFTDSPAWRDSVLAQALATTCQAVAGLASSEPIAA